MFLNPFNNLISNPNHFRSALQQKFSKSDPCPSRSPTLLIKLSSI